MKDVVVLDHTVEVYVPSQCVCGEGLPEDVRAEALAEVKRRFHGWFGGYSVIPVNGGWVLPDGKIAEEAVDIVSSKTGNEGLEEHGEDVKRLAVELADRLSQDRVALIIDGRMLLYPRSQPRAACVHKAATRVEPGTGAVAEAVKGARTPEERDRLKAIHAIVQRDWGQGGGLEAARDLFCGVLGYTFAGGHLPCYKWPEAVANHLDRAPTILADANGFQIVYLALSRDGLLRVPEREVIARVLKDNPSFRGLFVVSDQGRKQWELVNPKVSSESARGLILRRLRVGLADGGRTTTERLALVDLSEQGELEASAIQALHDKAFDVEIVTKRFYQDYAEVFSGLEALLPDTLDSGERRRFAQTLLNRLMFLRFIERKGWLEFEGRVRYDYLRSLFRAGQHGKKSFYRERLRRLFFEGLGEKGNGAPEVIGKVPFLNGGLFEECALDKKVKDVPDEAFEPIIGKDGLLYHYNFTVQESTPVDVEVAVDPEMLGKVFEELVTGRHESGSYYTPRPIVSFMCREALKGYLVDKAECSEEGVAALVDDHDAGELRPVEAGRIIEALEHLKAVDPACGSGAYLLGLLHEMIGLYQLIYRRELVTEPRSLYDLKLHIISHSLYGVDIDPLAVNIAMLRLWLSLIVDFEGDDPPPLPNLDFKIECGDSLLGPDPQIKDLFLVQFFEAQAAGLQKNKDKYMKAHGKNKEVLREFIEKQQKRIEKQLASAREGTMHWCLHFAEVFGNRGGFDVVLANPPYVRQELISEIKPQLKETYPTVYCGTADLYCYFYARAIELLRPDGMLAFISSNKWFRSDYGKNLRQHVAEACHVWSITDFGDLPVFESATAYPMIFIAQRRGVSDTAKEAGGRRGSTRFTRVPSLEPPYPDVLAVIRAEGSKLPKDAVKGANWSLTNANTAARLRKMEQAGVPLSEYVGGQIYRGILTGFNKAFVIDGRKRAELIAEDAGSEEIIKPLAVGKDIRKWRIDWRDRWLIVTKIGVDMERYPAVLRHLSQWKKELEKRYDKGKHWWELRACDYYGEFDKPKIVYQEIATYQSFAYDTDGTYLNNKVFMIPSDDLYLLAILNSSHAWSYLDSRCSKLSGGAFAMQTPYLSALPVPEPPGPTRKRLESLARGCVKGASDESEREIDEIVAGLYGL